MSLKKYLVFSVIFSTFVMCFVDAVIAPPYFYKALIKLFLFLLMPTICVLTNKQYKEHFRKLFIPKKKDILLSSAMGFGMFCSIVLAYLLFGKYIDLSGVKLNKDDFLYVATYVALCNSLLEEFFFRGYAFLLLKETTNRKFAYLFSAAMFAIYHAGMLNGWFNMFVYILVMIGLFIAGCIFNFLNEKCDNIYPSWLFHMGTNFGINTIGLMLLGFI